MVVERVLRKVHSTLCIWRGAIERVKLSLSASDASRRVVAARADIESLAFLSVSSVRSSTASCFKTHINPLKEAPPDSLYLEHIKSSILRGFIREESRAHTCHASVCNGPIFSHQPSPISIKVEVRIFEVSTYICLHSRSKCLALNKATRKVHATFSLHSSCALVAGRLSAGLSKLHFVLHNQCFTRLSL